MTSRKTFHFVAPRHKGARITFQAEKRVEEIAIASTFNVVPEPRPRSESGRLIELLASGGDARIRLDPVFGLNKYLAAPYPRGTMAYASSTANDISAAAFEHLLDLLPALPSSYGVHLEQLRGRIRSAYGLADDIAIVFAPSGTDLEYVALASVTEKAPNGIHNILLGADEVGSGCIHSAHGRYFAQETAREIDTTPGGAVPGLDTVSLADIPVRCPDGGARATAQMAQSIGEEIEAARRNGRHALVHVVHGSKTGLILPEMSELDDLQARYGEGADFVVDACQARITAGAVQDYLERGAMVFLSGSKFMGGPPFNGFALCPSRTVRSAAPLPEGFAGIFRRAEWPEDWPGRAILPDEDNWGLALRLEASIFELERFNRLPFDHVCEVTRAFVRLVQSEIADPLGLRIVATHPAANEAREHPIEMRTLVTLDLGALPHLHDFEDAQLLHRKMAMNGIRLGQPVKCVRLNGSWGPTLRVCLSMPQFTDLGGDLDAIRGRLAADMAQIAESLREEH